jgi:TonB family protein
LVSRRARVDEDKSRRYLEGGTVSFPGLRRRLAVVLLLIGGCAFTFTPSAAGQETTRKTKTRVAPAYPDLARRMKIAGVVKVQIIVAVSGSVKDAKVIGGHPVLANAVLEAVRKWRFEAGPQETSESLEFRFDPND